MKRKLSSCSIDCEREGEVTARDSSESPRLDGGCHACEGEMLGLASSPPRSLLPPPRSPLPPSPLPAPLPPPLHPSSLRSSSSNLSLISTSSRTNYDVFLSFRGPDTRKNFADYLYTSLNNAGIRVFRDNNDLVPGENIPEALVQSIKQSKILIPIISEDYASSCSCLMELAQIMKCKNADTQLIVPIFYHVNPADLKFQLRRVGESFRKHEGRGIDYTVIDTWKRALQEITEMKGYDVQNTCDGYEGELAETVVLYILKLLKKNDLNVTDRLVGIEPHVREIMKKLGVIYANELATQVYDEDVHVLGIWGTPGIGKTTVAKVVYNKIHGLFQCCSFLSNIRENFISNRLMGLQEQLISDLQKKEYRKLRTCDEGAKVIANSFSNMKVLILLDDVHGFDQIKHLVGKLSWFGPGSRILMTVGRIDVLGGFGDGVADNYEVGEMGHDQALQLFRKHAFSECPHEEEDVYDSLSKSIVKSIGGLPLAIELIASHLHSNKRDIRIWQEALQRVPKKLEDRVREAIDVSYCSLDEMTKMIFLDIACFFIGTDERIPSYMWHACEYYPSTGIKLLRAMSLVKTGDNNELWMHNQVRQYGRDIVRMEDCNEPQKRSRLWNHIDALRTLEEEQAAKKVEALALTFDKGQSKCFKCEQFRRLQCLRFLRLDQATVEGSSHSFLSNLSRFGLVRFLTPDQINFGKSPQNVLSELRWLDWQGCSQISQLLIFHLEKLVILDLSHSLVTGDSQAWGLILKKAKELKVLNLSGCRNLNAFPDFHASMYLERLVLEHCSALSQIGPLIGNNLNNLVSLNIKFCRFVSKLPQLCHMKNLEELLIDGTAIKKIDFKTASMEKLKILSACQCKYLAHISPSIGHLKSLVHLRLDGVAIASLPDSIKSLEELRTLLLGNCENLLKLPDSIGNLESLEVMDLSSTKIVSLPGSIKHLKNLKVLKMKNTHLGEFPNDIIYLKKLEEIDLSKCWNLKGLIRCDMSGLSSLKILRLSSTGISGLPSLRLLSDLQQLDLNKCDQLRYLEELPSSLSILRWGCKTMGTVRDLSSLRNLKELYFGDNFDPTDPIKNSSLEPQIGWLARLASLEILELCHSEITKLPEHFSRLQLKKLVLHYACLRDLGELPSSLSILCLDSCTIRYSLFSTVIGLYELELKRCHLAETVSLENLRRLQLLKISDCNVQKLDGLEILPHFRTLILFDCPSLTGLPDRTSRKFEINGFNFPEEHLVGSYVARTDG